MVTVKVGIQSRKLCGATLSGGVIAQDWYGYLKTWIEIDVETLKKLAKKYRDEIAKFRDWVRYYGNLCTFQGCGEYLASQQFDFLLKLLEQEGIKYEVKTASCEEARSVKIDLYPLEALDPRWLERVARWEDE